MAENLIIHTGSKEEKYRELLPQLHALVSTEADLIANLANMVAALKQTFGFFWVGFYWVRFKAPLPALASALAEEFAEPLGKKPVH